LKDYKLVPVATDNKEVVITYRITLILSRKPVFDLFRILLIVMTYIDAEAACGIRTQTEINLLQRDVVIDCVPAADFKFVNGLHMKMLLRKSVYSRRQFIYRFESICKLKVRKPLKLANLYFGIKVEYQKQV
jgi:hypothetical protein